MGVNGVSPHYALADPINLSFKNYIILNLQPMNKLYYFASLLIITIMLSGCRSEELVKPTTALKKLKTVSTGYTDLSGDVIYETKTFSYNSAGKVSGVILNNSGSNSHIDSMTYTYSRDSVKAITVSIGYPYAPLNKSISTQLYKLNSKGYVISSVLTTQSQGNLIQTYEYDANGYCTKMTQSSAPNNMVATFKYLNGNMISSVWNFGTQVFNEEMTYYLDKINTLIPNNNEGIDYFGNESKNLVKTEHLSGTGSSDITCQYDYEFDANNYVKKRITTIGNNITWDKYTYQ
jgi:hypothetical protein